MNNTEEDIIREPDKVKIEKLIDDNSDSLNTNTNNNQKIDLDTILEMSKNEYLEQQQKELDALCNKLKEEYHQEKQNKFNTVKIQLNKVILFDKPNLHYYELILSIIEMYESGVIVEYKTNVNEHTNIFKLLKTIRIPNNEFENLKKLIIYE